MKFFSEVIEMQYSHHTQPKKQWNLKKLYIESLQHSEIRCLPEIVARNVAELLSPSKSRAVQKMESKMGKTLEKDGNATKKEENVKRVSREDEELLSTSAKRCNKRPARRNGVAENLSEAWQRLDYEKGSAVTIPGEQVMMAINR